MFPAYYDCYIQFPLLPKPETHSAYNMQWEKFESQNQLCLHAYALRKVTYIGQCWHWYSLFVLSIFFFCLSVTVYITFQ